MEAKHTLGQSIYADPKAPHQELTAAQRAILEAVPVLNADSVRRYVASKWPQAMQSPLAQAMHGASAMTMLEASDADAVALLGEAMEHAKACLAACDGWTVETLGHNIESAFGMDLDADECDDIARAAIAKAKPHDPKNPQPARRSAAQVMDMTKFRLAQEEWDYRAEPEPTDIDALESWTDAVIATIGRACRVAREGDWIAARDLLMSAARDLAESPMPDEL